MKKKKTIVSCIFATLIVLTAIYTVMAAVESYNYDMANGVDILEGFGAVMIMTVGGFIVFYELDLFCTVYYFFIKPKTLAKSILNILSNLCLLLVFFGEYYKDIFEEDTTALFIVFFTYAILRISYFTVLTRGWAQEQ